MKNPPKIFLGIPAYGNIDPMFTMALIKCLQTLKIPHVLPPIHAGDSLVSRARNSITRHFLETDCTHLMWIDSDLVFNSEQIVRLVEADKDVIGGLYCKKAEGRPQLVLNRLPGQPLVNNPDGFTKVNYVGTGFMLIKREVFLKMIEAYPEIAYTADETSFPEWDFWSVGVHKGTGRYLSEDWYFCQRCQEMGIDVWVADDVLVNHRGSAVFPLKTQLPFLSGGSGFSTAEEGGVKASLSSEIPTETIG